MENKFKEASFIDSDLLGASKFISKSSFVVMKFDADSVSTKSHWETIVKLVKNRQNSQLIPIIVHSSLSGVQDLLNEIIENPASTNSKNILNGIREQHYSLASSLHLDGETILDDLYAELEQLVSSVYLIKEVNTQVHVRIVALGKLMVSKIGSSYLESQGISVQCTDAKDLLTSIYSEDTKKISNYLSANCDFSSDASLQSKFIKENKVILTQGQIAKNLSNETVLLGRNTSDLTASYLAAKLQACRLEIWNNNPGMFSTDPQIVPSARMLASLHYDEAQELSSAANNILNPRCIAPLKESNIPLFIRCTAFPELNGTVISSVTEEIKPHVKGICIRNGLTLISMDGVNMWHEVGFLAKAFTIFSNHGVSIDLVSTSETNVTVSVDSSQGSMTKNFEELLVNDLKNICSVRLIKNCSAVSLVGRKIRTIMSQLAPAFKVFEEEKIHLMSQAANDLNLSFVIDEQQGPRLMAKLHSSMIGENRISTIFGDSWEEIYSKKQNLEHSKIRPWWVKKKEKLLKIANTSLNTYVYDSETVIESINKLLNIQNVDNILYAMKANDNPELLKVIAKSGVDFECVSPGEIEWLKKSVPNIDTKRILFTPNFAPREEYEWALSENLLINLDNLYPLKAWPEIFSGKDLFIRIDPGQGRGHHDHVKTAGIHSKFGIPEFEIEELKNLITSAGANVIGIHAHSGSGILDPDNWRKIANTLVRVAEKFPSVETIDLGGGLGVPEKPGDIILDLEKLNQTLSEIKESYPKLKLWLEPGRFLVSNAGVLLTHCTQIKGKGEMSYIGVSTGMNSLIRPALYGSYHEIVNLSNLDKPQTNLMTIVGPICETGDKLGSDRLMPLTFEGDVILIANAGAYGYVMSSNYNRRKIAEEVVI